MLDVIWATPLYEFLRQCNESPLEKVVLDCGAGGKHPAISLFTQYGYTTYGIEIALDQLDKATRFSRENRMSLNVLRGDVRRIPFASESFSFVYAFHTVYFLTKPDIARAMAEIARVLRPNGLCYVNFLSVDDPDDRSFCQTSPLRSLLGSGRFAKHEDDEADAHFCGFDILRKEKRLIDKVHGQGRLKQAYVEYIARKHET